MEYETKTCPMCEAENAPIGGLGRMDHYNCRACGMWYHHEREMHPAGPCFDPDEE